LVVELKRMEEEELQGQLMSERHYMIDEDDSNNLHYEHVQATATLRSEVVVACCREHPKIKTLLLKYM